jgi:hypothetical protein
MLAGQGLGEVEQELIDPAPLAADRKAVLWLLAWSLLPPGYQLAEVDAHIALLLRSSEPSHGADQLDRFAGLSVAPDLGGGLDDER